MTRRFACMALLALGASAVAPAHAGAITHAPRSFFGVLLGPPISTVHQRPALLRQEIDRMHAAGVGSVRVPVWWDSMQKRRHGRIRWEQLDRAIGLAARRGLTVLPVVQSAPCWATGRPCKRIKRPADLGAFGRFIRALAARYGPGGKLWRRGGPALPIRRWQIWNEPQFAGFWGGPDWAASYTRALAVARANLRAVDPQAQVVLAGLSNFSWRELAALYRAGVRRQFDVAALQTFTSRPENVLVAARLMRRAMAANGDRAKPLLLTEVAWAATPRRQGLALPAIQVGPVTQARNLEALYALAEANRHELRIEGVFWSTWLSGYRSPVQVFDYTGLRRYHARTGRVGTTPALRAFRRVARTGD